MNLKNSAAEKNSLLYRYGIYFLVISAIIMTIELVYLRQKLGQGNAEGISSQEKTRKARVALALSHSNIKALEESLAVVDPGKPIESKQNPEKILIDGAEAVEDTEKYRYFSRIMNRSKLDAKYAVLFRRLNLPISALESLKQILIEKQLSESFATRLAMTHDVLPDEPEELAEFYRTCTKAQTEQIHALVGDEQFQYYDSYERNFSERREVNRVAERLQASGVPLDDQQIDQLVELTTKKIDFRKSVGPAVIPDSVFELYANQLSPEQLKVVREFRDQSLALLKMYQSAADKQKSNGTGKK